MTTSADQKPARRMLGTSRTVSEAQIRVGFLWATNRVCLNEMDRYGMGRLRSPLTSKFKYLSGRFGMV
jgi:hypothetical protein